MLEPPFCHKTTWPFLDLAYVGEVPFHDIAMIRLVQGKKDHADLGRQAVPSPSRSSFRIFCVCSPSEGAG